MRTFASVLITICFACSSETDREPVPAACGTAAVEAPALTCTGIADCGSGSSNEIQPTFCEHCLVRPDTEICEAGVCKPLGTTGNIKTAFAVPPEATGALSYAVASIYPVMADGTKITCAALLTTCGFLKNGAINTGNSTFKAFGTPAEVGFAYQGLISIGAGSDRLLFIQVTTETQGKGTVVAQGCAEGIDVVAGEDTTVPIDVLAP